MTAQSKLLQQMQPCEKSLSSFIVLIDDYPDESIRPLSLFTFFITGPFDYKLIATSFLVV